MQQNWNKKKITHFLISKIVDCCVVYMINLCCNVYMWNSSIVPFFSFIEFPNEKVKSRLKTRSEWFRGDCRKWASWIWIWWQRRYYKPIGITCVLTFKIFDEQLTTCTLLYRITNFYGPIMEWKKNKNKKQLDSDWQLN